MVSHTNMLHNVRSGRIKQLCHKLLYQPQRVIFQSDLNRIGFALRSKNQKLCGTFSSLLAIKIKPSHFRTVIYHYLFFSAIKSILPITVTAEYIRVALSASQQFLLIPFCWNKFFAISPFVMCGNKWFCFSVKNR